MHDSHLDVLESQQLTRGRVDVVDGVGALVTPNAPASAKRMAATISAMRSSDSRAGVEVTEKRRTRDCVRIAGGAVCVDLVAVGSTRTSSGSECMRNS